MQYCKVVFELLGNAMLCRGKALKPKLYHVRSALLSRYIFDTTQVTD